MYYSALASSVVVVVGMLVSFATGVRDPRKMDPRLIIPLGTRFGCCLPERWRQMLNFYVGEEFVSYRLGDLFQLLVKTNRYHAHPYLATDVLWIFC